MQILTTLSELRALVAAWRQAGERVALVPTMGNLHDGHIDLVNRAREHAAHVVVSVFVNPLQFGENEDFDRYPRTPDTDAEKVRAAGTDILFTPAMEEVYPHGLARQTQVTVPGVSDILCGAFRPGHFSGVATVVNMLLNMVQPDVALFGEKDYQQLFVIRCMVRDLHMPIEIVGVPTVREASGLALSSRNQYLTAVQRRQASMIYRCLQTTAGQLRAGNHDFGALQKQGAETLSAAGFRPDYYEVLSSDFTVPAEGDKDLVILVAAWLGRARLLDNLRVQL